MSNNYKENNEALLKLLNSINKQRNEFWDHYINEDSTPNDLLNQAMSIINMQSGAIQNLMAKLKLIEDIVSTN